MNRVTTTLVLAAAILGLLVAPVTAQTMPQSSASDTSGYSASGAAPSAPAAAMPQEKQVEGPVKKIDPAAKTVEIGRFFGLLTTKLEVTDDTNISIDGKKGSLEDLQEGTRAKASYESGGGKNIAKSIEVMAPQMKGAAAKSGGSTGG